MTKKRDDILDARIKAALNLQPPQTLSADFIARLRREAERTAVPVFFKEMPRSSTAIWPLSAVQAVAAVLLFFAGLSFGIGTLAFINKTANTSSLNLYSFYDYGRGGLL